MLEFVPFNFAWSHSLLMASMHTDGHLPFDIWLGWINRNRLPSIRAAFVRTLSLSMHVGVVVSNNRNNKWSEMCSTLESELYSKKREENVSKIQFKSQFNMKRVSIFGVFNYIFTTKTSVTLASAHDAFMRTTKLSSCINVIMASVVFSI